MLCSGKIQNFANNASNSRQVESCAPMRIHPSTRNKSAAIMPEACMLKRCGNLVSALFVVALWAYPFAVPIYAGIPGIYAPSSVPASTSDEIPLNCPARYITAMISDGHGGVWVSGEDSGIYHGTLKIIPSRAGLGNGNSQTSEPPGSSRRSGNFTIQDTWTHYDRSNSGLISDHIYSLCLDSQGRLWAGTDRHGVCVYNGRKWKHYGILTGPIGSHIIAIAKDPRNNSVWMCSESGISIYQCGGNLPSHNSRLPSLQPRYAPHTWHYITAMNGLPASPDCIAFNKQGTAFVGTLCNGLAIARYPYTHWRTIHGPWRSLKRPWVRGCQAI